MTEPQGFKRLNRAFNTVFQQGRLSIGLVVPLESYMRTAEPTMDRHLERARLAEEHGFAALWLRDVPFNVPSFGDAGQMFDPFVYLGVLAAVTERIALCTGGIILPLRHPAHVAKSAATADVLSNGRLLLGVASGDRPEEYPAMGMGFENRAERFRDSFAYIRATAEPYPVAQTHQGTLQGGVDMLPKPTAGQLPLLVTGGSRQDPDWIAEHSDGWIAYPRAALDQARVVADYRQRIAALGLQTKPVSQSLYVDLQSDPNAAPRAIHLGFASGTAFLLRHLEELQSLGVNHVAINLRFNQAYTEATMVQLSRQVLPHFPTQMEAP